MYLCILSLCGKETPSIQEFRVRRYLCTANSGKTFHRGSLRCRYGASLGWNTNSHRGECSENSSTSGARWVLRLSILAYIRSTVGASHPSTCPRKVTQLAAVRCGYAAVRTSPV